MSAGDRHAGADPFTVTCIADFGVSVERGVTRVQAGGFQDLLDTLRPRLDLRTPDLLSGTPRTVPWTLAIRSMRDFDPASILENFPASAPLFAWRRLLAESARTGARIPALIEGFLGLWPDVIDGPAPGVATHPQPTAADAPIDSVLAHLVLPEGAARPVAPGGAADEPRRAAASPPVPTGIRQRVRFLFGLSATPWSTRLAQALVAVDQALQRQLETVLHDAALRDREAAWRSVFALAEEADLRRGDLRLGLRHAPRDGAAEALAALRSAPALEGGGDGRGMILVDHAASADAASATLLAEAAACAATRDEPVVLPLDPAFLGTGARHDRARAGALDEAALQAAASIASTLGDFRVILACNRFLFRPPYVSGETTEALAGWRENVDHPAGPWAQAVWIAGRAAAAAVRRDGPEAARGLAVARVSALPLRPIGPADDPELSLPLEFLLDETEARRLVDAGLAPLTCAANDDVATLAGLALPPRDTAAGATADSRAGAAEARAQGDIEPPATGISGRFTVQFPPPAPDKGSPS